MNIEIHGVAPHIDGSYPIDLGSFSSRELHQIKTISNVRPLEMTEAFVYSDAAFAVAVGLIALTRAGKRINEDILMDAPAGSIKFSFEQQEDGTDDPPTVPGRPGTKPRSSGRRSSRSSASPEGDPSRSGEQT